MQLPEVIGGGGPGDGSRLPAWLGRALLVAAVVAVTVVAGRPILYGPAEPGGDDRATPTGAPAATPPPVVPIASGPLPAVPAGTPRLSFVGRIPGASAGAEPSYVAVGSGTRPLSVPSGPVVPADDGKALLVAGSEARLFSVPVDPDSAGERIGRASTVLGSRGDRVYVTTTGTGSTLQLRVVGRADGEILNRRYLTLSRGEVPVGIVDAGNAVAAIVRIEGAPGAGTLVLRWPDGAQVQLTRNGRFLGASAGLAAIAPGPDECGSAVGRCLLVVRPGAFKDLRGGTVVAPEGWTPDLGGGAVAFARGAAVFPVRDAAGVRALAAAWPSSLTARLVPGSRDMAGAYGLTSARGRYLVWGVGAPGQRVTPVVWDAARPDVPARLSTPTLPPRFQFVCACP